MMMDPHVVERVAYVDKKRPLLIVGVVVVPQAAPGAEQQALHLIVGRLIMTVMVVDTSVADVVI